MDTRTAEPSTVAEILLEEFLKPHQLSPDIFAKHIGLSEDAVIALLDHSTVISDGDAEKLGSFFQTGADFWRQLRDAHVRWEMRMLQDAKNGG